MKADQRFIELRGVRVHNLKSVDLDLPTGQLIVFTGVSGSGKSSLAFDTLYAEGQRRYIETFSAYTRQFLERLDKPDADRIEGIPPAIAVGQRQGKRSARSTVGTITEIHEHLAILFARFGESICRNCGIDVEPADATMVTKRIDDFAEGTRYLVAFPVDVRPETDIDSLYESFRVEGFTRVRVDGKITRLDQPDKSRPIRPDVEVIVDRLTRGTDAASRRLDSIETAFKHGLGRCRLIIETESPQSFTFFRGRRCSQCGLDAPDPDPGLFRYNTPIGACESCQGTGMQTLAEDDTHVCEACHGHRLRPESRSIRLGGRDFTQVVSLPIHETLDYLKSLVTDTQPLIIKAIDRAVSRLNFLEQIGLGYLSLARPARTLSAGESRRVSLTSALGSGLVNTLYVLDEPSIGLHPRDIARLVKVIEAIRDAGNTVVVVEHDEDVMLAADHLVDIGPGAGEGGGRVIYRGPPRALLNVPESLTAQFLNGGRRVAVPDQRRTSTGRITIQGAAGHNLKGIDVTFPLGVFCVVTGVSGAGKSTLIDETLVPAVLNQIKQQNLPCLPYKSLKIEGQVNELILVDQSPIGRSARSNPVTYLKAFDEIRKTFAATHEAKTRNYAASKFSFNVDGGRCSTCEGNGQLLIDMQFLADVTMCCPDCKGTRYRAEVLEVTYRGKSIAEVLDLTAREAFGFFRSRPKIQARLRPLLDVGLEYLRLGQPGSTLSGGEAQRLKLASYLASSPGAMARASVGPKTLFVFDEPTTGLHPADTLKLIEALRSLLVIGHSLLIVEHNPDIMMSADWLIDLGPEAGADGGRVVGQGTPEDLAKLDTATGRVLAQYLNRSS